MNWSALKSELRVELDDTGASPKWSDEILFVYLREAIADYSQYFPLAVDNLEITPEVSDARKFSMPNDFLEEVQVLCSGSILELREARSGFKIISGDAPQFYYVKGLSLYLDTNPNSENVFLTYSALHSIPASAADNEFLLTIPLVDVELIKLYILGKVYTKVRSAQSRLDRFKLGSGDRNDNPVKPETEDYFARYYQKVAERQRNTSHFLSRPRRYK